MTTKIPAELVSDEVFGRRNLIINGDMRVAQRATSTSSVTDSGYHTVDRWETAASSAGTWTISQSTTVPSGEGFAYSQKFDCTTADSSLDASNLLIFRQKIEGINVQHLKYGTSSAKKLTLSFWVRSAKTGTYIVEFFNDNSSENKTQSQSYTINSANTWEKKTITIDGDTAHSIENTTNAELLVYFWLAAGSTYSGGGSLNTSWSAIDTVGNTVRAVGQVNLADSTSNDWYITGVQLEVSDQATPFEHLSYGEELAMCQRYYQKSSDGTPAQNSFGGLQLSLLQNADPQVVVPLSPNLRAAPSMTLYSSYGSGTSSQWYGLAFGNSFSANARVFQTSTRHFIADNGDVGASQAGWCEIGWVADAEL